MAREITAAGVTWPLQQAPASDETVCSRWRFAPPGRYPGGAAILPQDLIVDWEDGLRHNEAAARWLLAPVVGVAAFLEGTERSIAGLAAENGDLAVCTSEAAPDLARRFAHPDLLHTRMGSGGRLLGPGPFLEAADGALVLNPDHAGPKPPLDRIELQVAADPGLLIELGQADVALVHGDVDAESEADSGHRLQRVPAWDRGFVLWLNPLARWVNDPRFRRWMVGAVKRQEMVEYLFDGQGAELERLLEGMGPAPQVDSVTTRPVSRQTEPRLTLSFVADDAHATSIAARIKATLREERLEVTLVPMPTHELKRQMMLGQVQTAILNVQPFFDEPLLRLREIASQFGAASADATLILDQAAALSDPDARQAAALAAEDVLLRDALVIPLARLPAWLAMRPNIRGIRSGPQRVLDFQNAAWVP